MPSINVLLTYDEMATMLASWRDGLRHMMGEAAFMREIEKRHPRDGVQMSEIIDREAKKTLELYFRLEGQHNEHRAAFIESVEKSLENDKEEPIVTEYVTDVQSVEIGQKVKYIGEECGLKPGRVYQVEDISEQESGVFLRVNGGYHRLDDFDLSMRIQPNDMVIYTGSDVAVSKGVYRVTETRSFGGTPYVTIVTDGDIYLCYPLTDFHLSEDGVDETQQVS